MARYERWTALVSAGLIFGALLACKKKSAETTPEASASAAAAVPPPVAPTQTSAPVDTPKLGDVKRYADKEKKSDEGAVRVLAEDLKVFNEADGKTPEVATLPKDALVFRLAEVDGFQLVEFPSGVGQFSQGWVEVKGLSEKPEKVAREAVLKDEKKVATVKTDGGVAPKASGSVSAKADAGAATDAGVKSDAGATTDAGAKSDAGATSPTATAPPGESEAEKKLKEAEKRAADAEKKAKEEEKKRKAAEKKAKEAERKAKEAAK
jgi:hypothetical protein